MTPPSFDLVNDTVMGGRSRSQIQVGSEGTFRFFGLLSLENGGGFASCRAETAVGFPKTGQSFMLRFRPDNRSYSVNLYPRNAPVAFSFRAPLRGVEGVWNEAILVETDFVPTRFGKIVGQPALGIFSTIQAWGIMIADRVSGPFQFDFHEVESRS